MRSKNVDESFTHINEYELEREWVRQPELAKEWNEKLADAQLLLDEAEDNFEIAKAEIAKEIRDDPEEFGIEKTTEGAIKEAIPLQSRYEKASKRVREAKHAVGVLKAAVIAVEHKKRALEKLVDLWLAGYHSQPRVKGEGGERMEEASKKAVRSKAVKQR